MKLPLSWLRSWVDLPWSDREIAARLTTLGFEVESLGAAAPAFSGVQVASIRSVAAHPQADKLRVCKVEDGHGHELQIVCGASNARAGMRSALATIGARLPGDVLIGASKIRGVESQCINNKICNVCCVGPARGTVTFFRIAVATVTPRTFWRNCRATVDKSGIKVRPHL